MTSVTRESVSSKPFVRLCRPTDYQHNAYMCADLNNPETAGLDTMRAVIASLEYQIQNANLLIDAHAAAWTAFKRDADTARADAHSEEHRTAFATRVQLQTWLDIWTKAADDYNPFADVDPGPLQDTAAYKQAVSDAEAYASEKATQEAEDVA